MQSGHRYTTDYLKASAGNFLKESVDTGLLTMAGSD
jgi:hypothetical protein